MNVILFFYINRERRLERWTLILGWFALREKSLGPVMPPSPRDCLIRQRNPLASEWSHSGMSLSVGKWVFKGVLGKLPADITVFSIHLSNKMATTMVVPMSWKKIFQHLVPLIHLLFFTDFLIYISVTIKTCFARWALPPLTALGINRISRLVS